MKKAKSFLIGLAVGIFLMGAMLSGAVFDRISGFGFLNSWLPKGSSTESGYLVDKQILNEENVVIGVVEKVTPGVVTVSISKTQLVPDLSSFDPFGLFGFQLGGKEEKIEQDIGTGFVLSSDGLIVTNRHVVSDTKASYKVVTAQDEVYEVKEIYRDPGSDLAVLRVEANNLSPLSLGDSDELKVGQTVIAIGTALGEFRSTVTSGVISGLGRGITAGSFYQGGERIDDVIQTDAAINPGNSGGPLLNSLGQVIGVNVAVSAQGQNIGFALPINIVKDMVKNFEETGGFERAYLGVSYKMISKKVALLNEVPEGAYIQEVLSGEPAEKAGLQAGDIIMELDGVRVSDEKGNTLSELVNKKRIGEEVKIKIWREGEEKEVKLRFEKKSS
jgi:serine protease Do